METKLKRITAAILTEMNSLTAARKAATPIGRPINKPRRRLSIGNNATRGYRGSSPPLKGITVVNSNNAGGIKAANNQSSSSHDGASALAMYPILLTTCFKFAESLDLGQSSAICEIRDENRELKEAELMTVEDFEAYQVRLQLQLEAQIKADIEAAEAEAIAVAAAAVEAAEILAAKLERSEQLRKLVAKPSSPSPERGRSAGKDLKGKGKGKASKSPAKGSKKTDRGSSVASNKSTGSAAKGKKPDAAKSAPSVSKAVKSTPSPVKSSKPTAPVKEKEEAAKKVNASPPKKTKGK